MPVIEATTFLLTSSHKRSCGPFAFCSACEWSRICWPSAGWHQMIGEATMADAILVRIIHNAHRIELKGDSMRRKTNRAILTQTGDSETLNP